MKSVAMIRTKHWNNAYSVMRTANGLGFDNVYLVDLVMGKPPKMQRRKIDLNRSPHDMFKLVTIEDFKRDIMPQYTPVFLELYKDAVDLADFKWPKDPLIIVGPENGSVPVRKLRPGLLVKIPMQGVVKCLNVACAASIAMWDQVLQEVKE